MIRRHGKYSCTSFLLAFGVFPRIFARPSYLSYIMSIIRRNIGEYSHTSLIIEQRVLPRILAKISHAERNIMPVV